MIVQSVTLIAVQSAQPSHFAATYAIRNGTVMSMGVV